MVECEEIGMFRLGGGEFVSLMSLSEVKWLKKSGAMERGLPRLSPSHAIFAKLMTDDLSRGILKQAARHDTIEEASDFLAKKGFLGLHLHPSLHCLQRHSQANSHLASLLYLQMSSPLGPTSSANSTCDP